MLKTYKIGYYSPIGADITGFFNEVSRQGLSASLKLGSYKYQLKRLRVVGDWVEGEFAKYRFDDIPLIGEPDTDRETPIDLGDHQGLVEKNFFRYNPTRRILMFQNVREASTVNRLSEYVSDLAGETVTFVPLIRPEDAVNLIAGGMRQRKLEISFAAVTGEILGIERLSNISRSLLQTMAGAGGRSMHLKIGLGRGHPDEYLSLDVRNLYRELIASPHVDVTSAKLQVVDEGDEKHDIDLIADRITGSIQIKVEGRYPAPGVMLLAMRENFEQLAEEINLVVG